MVSDQFPRGKLNADDEGHVGMAVSHMDRTVIVRFAEPCAWIGMDADGAIALAETLIKHARACGSTKPLTLRIG